MTIRPRIPTLDLYAKVGAIRDRLLSGESVTVRVVFRGREALQPEVGVELLERVPAAAGEACEATSWNGPATASHVEMVLLPRFDRL